MGKTLKPRPPAPLGARQGSPSPLPLPCVPHPNTPGQIGPGRRLPGLLRPVPGQGGEAGAGVGERGLGGGVGHPVAAQLQVGPVEQVSSGPLALLVVQVEALGRGAPRDALGKDAVDSLVEGELPGVRACTQQLVRDGIGREQLLGGETGVGLSVIQVSRQSRPGGVTVYGGDECSTSRDPSCGARVALVVGGGSADRGAGLQERPDPGSTQRQVSTQ